MSGGSLGYPHVAEPGDEGWYSWKYGEAAQRCEERAPHAQAHFADKLEATPEQLMLRAARELRELQSNVDVAMRSLRAQHQRLHGLLKTLDRHFSGDDGLDDVERELRALKPRRKLRERLNAYELQLLLKSLAAVDFGTAVCVVPALTPGKRWAAMCNAHLVASEHRTIRNALRAALLVRRWCKGCQLGLPGAL